MSKRKKRRKRIDTMIDAHVWMRRTARAQGEWPYDQRQDTPAEAALREALKHPDKLTITEG